MSHLKPLWILCFETVVRNPECVAAAGKLSVKYRNLVFSWLAAHDFLVDPDYRHALELFLAAEPLQWADLDCAGSVTAEFLGHLALNCERLQWLTLSCSFRALDDGVRALLGSLRQLKHLEIRELKIDKNALSSLKSPCLETLILQLYVRDESWRELEVVVENNPSIRVLSYSTRGRTLPREDDLAAKIRDRLSPNLTELELNNVAITKEVLSSLLLSCTRLKTLKLAGALQFDTETMQRVAVECKWQELEIDFKVTPPMQTYEALQHLPSTICSLSFRFGPSNRQMICASIMKLPNLRKLRYHTEFFNDALTEKLLGQIGQKLSSLDIGLSETLTDQGIGSIADHCPNLESLVIHSDANKYNRVVSAMPLLRVIQVPQNATKIRVLFLNYFKVLSSDFLQIVAAECVNLEELHLAAVRAVRDPLLFLLANNCPKLHLLDIRSCWGVTDDGVCALAQRLPLTSLNIAMCYRLTNATILALQLHCPGLENLLYNGIPGVSRDAIGRLNFACHKRLRSYFYQWLKSKLTPNRRFLNRIVKDSLPKQKQNDTKRNTDHNRESDHKRKHKNQSNDESRTTKRRKVT